jgi:DNA-binding NtrC family response regulator
MASGLQQHIFLVEKDEDTLSATTAMLEHLGYGVRSETDSLKALRTFSEGPDAYDLAILEPWMPQLSGLELCARFRRIRPGFPVVVYAAYLDTAEQLEAEGICGRVMLKPATMKEMADAVREALSGRGAVTTAKP